MNALDGAIFGILTYKKKILRGSKNVTKNTSKIWITRMSAFRWHKKITKKIGKMNNININVFRYEKREPYPAHISKEKFDILNLLLITNGEKQHYVLIKDFNKFMYNQTKHKCKKHFCMYCLQCFISEEVLNNHKENCIISNGAQSIKMSNAGDMVYFKNYHKELAAPFVIYADFEAITEKVHGCQPNNDKSYTESYQKHQDCGYGDKVVCRYDDKYSKPIQICRGENPVYKFMEKMLEVEWCKKSEKQTFQ